MGDAMPAPKGWPEAVRERASRVRVLQSHVRQIAFGLIGNPGVAEVGILDLLYDALGLPPAGRLELSERNPSRYLYLTAILDHWVEFRAGAATWYALWAALTACGLNGAALLLEGLFGQIFDPNAAAQE